MNKLFKILFLSFTALGFIYCGKKETSFSFRAVDPLEKNSLEQTLYRPGVFRQIKHGTPVFDKGKILWIAYTPAKSKYDKPYAVSLSRKSLGYIEINLRNRMLDPAVGSIVDKYEDLDEGDYLLRVALSGEVIDQIYFRIVKTENDSAVNYESDPENDPEAQ